VLLRVFGVGGHVVRTLVNSFQEARSEPYVILWDDKNDQGDQVSGGIFFYEFEAAGHRSTRKIVVLQ
jgi:uncharacterized protein involved in tellurium resistance